MGCYLLGSRGDSWILRQTSLWKYWNQYFPRGDRYSAFYYILGDSGFKLLRWLMTPFTRRQENSLPAMRDARRMFSRDQKSTRACGEDAFGLLKGRWRCLRYGLQCLLCHATATVMACVVLHNVCIMRGDLWSFYDRHADADEDIGLQEPAWVTVDRRARVPPSAGDAESSKRAFRARDALAVVLRVNRRRREAGQGPPPPMPGP